MLKLLKLFYPHAFPLYIDLDTGATTLSSAEKDKRENDLKTRVAELERLVEKLYKELGFSKTGKSL